MADDVQTPDPRPPALQRASNGRHRWMARGSLAWTDLPGAAVTLVLIAVFVLEVMNGGPLPWGVSAQAMREGRFGTLFTQIFVHAGLTHLWMNVSALLSLSPALLIRLGPVRRTWLPYLVLFLSSGVAGAAMYVALNPFGTVPAIGASGAICGLWGAVARLTPEGALAPLWSRHVGQTVRSFVVSNAILFAILFVLVRMSGGVGGLAWQSHLGGFLVGLLAGPWIMGFAHRARVRPDA